MHGNVLELAMPGHTLREGATRRRASKFARGDTHTHSTAMPSLGAHKLTAECPSRPAMPVDQSHSNCATASCVLAFTHMSVAIRKPQHANEARRRCATPQHPMSVCRGVAAQRGRRALVAPLARPPDQPQRHLNRYVLGPPARALYRGRGNDANGDARAHSNVGESVSCARTPHTGCCSTAHANTSLGVASTPQPSRTH